MNALTADEIRKAQDIQIEPLEIPEWGGTVYTRTISGTGRDELERAIAEKTPGGKSRVSQVNLRARVAVRVLCDSTGNLLFKPEDAEELGKKSGKALERIFDRACLQSGLMAHGVEGAAKNS